MIIEAPFRDSLLEDFRRAAFSTVESLAKQSKLLNIHHAVFIEKLIPALST